MPSWVISGSVGGPRSCGKGAATKNLDEQTAKQKLSLKDSAVLIRERMGD